jgi:DNA-binding NtrC family response regulator
VEIRAGQPWRAPGCQRFVSMKRIFFAEDKALFRSCPALLLEQRMGVECIKARPFADAHWVLDHLQGGMDLAIVELDLSDGDGLELVERLHELRFGVPVAGTYRGSEPGAAHPCFGGGGGPRMWGADVRR